MFTRTFQWFLNNRRKLLPMVTVLILGLLAAVTDFFGQAVREVVSKALEEYATKIVPTVVNLLIAALLLNVAWLLYGPICSGVEVFLKRSGASQRGKDMLAKLLKLGYWGGSVFVVLTLTGSQLLGNLVIGFSVFGAALTLALKDVMNDFICGLFTQGSAKVTEGDVVELEGLKVKGKVQSVGYLTTVLVSAEATTRVPNREIWARAVHCPHPQAQPQTPPPTTAPADPNNNAGWTATGANP